MADKNKVVFGVGRDNDNVPVVILGVTKSAWDYIKDGSTNTFDLTKLGLNVRIVMFGAGSYDEAVALLKQGGAKDMTKTDFGIKPQGDS